MSGDSFQSESFGDIKSPVKIIFESANIDYIPESSFESVLDKNKQNEIEFSTVGKGSTIDCSHCGNKWLDNYPDQARYLYSGPLCKGKRMKHLIKQ